jgi:hypothetical protein
MGWIILTAFGSIGIHANRSAALRDQHRLLTEVASVREGGLPPNIRWHKITR